MMLERQEFFALMSEAAAAQPRTEFVGGRVPAGRVKTRILEAHAPEASSDGVQSLVRRIEKRSGLSAELVGDELWWLGGDRLVGFLDTLNPRFWQLHSTSPANAVKSTVRSIVVGDPLLDTAWLPRALLQELDGVHLWVKSAFEADELLGADVSARRWRARFEGEAPEGLLELLRGSPYERAATITGLGSRVSEPEVGEAMVVADYTGAFVMGEGDFSVAASAVWTLLSRYEQWVQSLEDRHRLSSRALDDSGIVVEGDVATICFGREVEDLDRLVRGLFTAKEPFRLWGVPERAGDGWFVDAVDLHVGHPLRIDVLRDRLRVLLESETCGNTLARLLTNLQQRLDARAVLLPVGA
ncbi:MAG: hypothetical protein QOH12_1911 [Solirubrobacteraceae bacterium]|jgi:hypothetical protein|nr:hypothetical protein [Solirubrobacteraceae bacterium]